MKKVILLLAMFSLSISMLFAQSHPEGMNYQAVARNLKGEILADQPIALKVTLFSVQNNSKTEYYREVHDVVTSAAGVFSLIIGKGKLENGVYNKVPWSTSNIWMEVSIKSKGQSDFALISNSQLLAVPYAYHALTAEKVMSDGAGGPGVPSQNWSLFGNSNSNANVDKLGTTDSVDLVVVTNNLDRLRIYANGNIFIKKSLRIGANLTVDSSAYLNKLGGETINYGPLTVDRQSPTLLSGTLTVDLATDLNSSLNVDGITDLNSRLNVNNNSATLLTGTLRVDGITDLNNNFNVNNMSPSLLTGTLQVNKDVLFKEKLLLDNATHQATSTTTGALVVNGGLGLGGNLHVGGTSAFGGPVSFAAAVNITDLTQSVDTITGALIVRGGVGIGKRLNVGQGVFFHSTLGVNGLVSLNNTLESSAIGNGSLVVAGGTGIAKNLHVGGTVTAAGATTINNTLSVNASTNGYIAQFKNNNNSNGISIQVGAATPANANDFVTFRNSSGSTVGRIEGETLSELNGSPDYVNERNAFIFEVTTGSVDLAIAGFEVAQGVVDVVAAASSSTACVGFGACITAPIPSFIIAAGTSLVLKIANAASEAASLAGAIITRNNYVSNMESNIGVTYQSGSADYAEWLPKSNPSEKFFPGYVVGLSKGRISLNTTGAEKFFVISTKPIVLGNMPEAGKESAYEKVAFMGQVPVQVLGKVNAGDYILPSGKNNGFAVAVAPGKMKPDDYTKIVGVAWASSENDTYSQVNVAIGLNSSDISKVVAEQSLEINALRSKIDQTNSILAGLIPGFKEAAGLSGKDVAKTAPAPVNNNDLHDKHLQYTKPDAANIVFFDISRDQVKAMFEMAEKIFNENGGDANAHPFWKKIKSDPGYKETIMQQVEGKFKNAMHTHKEINKQYLSGGK